MQPCATQTLDIYSDYAQTIYATPDFVNTLPVSPAMASVGNRGVWKAPANVGLNAVTIQFLC